MIKVDIIFVMFVNQILGYYRIFMDNLLRGIDRGLSFRGCRNLGCIFGWCSFLGMFGVGNKLSARIWRMGEFFSFVLRGLSWQLQKV